MSKELLFTYVTDWTFAIDAVGVLDTHTHTHTLIYIYTYIHTYIYVYILYDPINRHTHTHTYIYTLRKWKQLVLSKRRFLGLFVALDSVTPETE